MGEERKEKVRVREGERTRRRYQNILKGARKEYGEEREK